LGTFHGMLNAQLHTFQQQRHAHYLPVSVCAFADCPAGYGMLPSLPPPTWPGRHLMTTLPALDVSPAAWEQTAASNTTEAPATLSAALAAAEGLLTSPADPQSVSATLTAANYSKPYVLQNAKPGLWLPDPLPIWASLCLPCPVNYYSAGGQQGFAECKPCPGSYTTAGATAAANCLCKCLLRLWHQTAAELTLSHESSNRCMQQRCTSTSLCNVTL
jgi:hypothetical protein